MKAREYWIQGAPGHLEYTETFISNKDPKTLPEEDDYMWMKNRECTHVVEYSEYEKLKKAFEWADKHIAFTWKEDWDDLKRRLGL